jgi:endonuclease III
LPLPEARRRFRRQLLTWYRKHGRDLPWRKTDNPYHILVSEIMLQQTQVDRVLPKYHEWLARYPSFEALAAAAPDEVTRTWYPLGYNIRPRRLQTIAREAVDRYGGLLPSDEQTLLSFKGIGQYTAGAIRSFAFRERAAILDTNVARVLSRVFLGAGRCQGARHAPAPVGDIGCARPQAARLRLQPGIDGFRRHRVHRAEADLSGLPHAASVPRVSLRQLRSQGRGASAFVTPRFAVRVRMVVSLPSRRARESM